MKQQDFKNLARRYSVDCGVLLDAKRYSSAYYLAGYTIECALKACAAKGITAGFIPDKKWIDTFYTHKLTKLAEIAEIADKIKRHGSESPEFGRFWDLVVSKWGSEARYSGVSRRMAEEMVRAVNDKNDGVFSWLRNNW